MPYLVGVSQLWIYYVSALHLPFCVILEPDCKLCFPLAPCEALPTEGPRGTLRGWKRPEGFFGTSQCPGILAAFLFLAQEWGRAALAVKCWVCSSLGGRWHVLVTIHFPLSSASQLGREGGSWLTFPSGPELVNICFPQTLSHPSHLRVVILSSS